MKRIILALSFLGIGCGATDKVVEQAEVKCLDADYASLKAKLATGLTSATGEAIALTTQEITCALEALGTKAPPADAGAQ